MDLRKLLGLVRAESVAAPPPPAAPAPAAAASRGKKLALSTGGSLTGGTGFSPMSLSFQAWLCKCYIL